MEGSAAPSVGQRVNIGEVLAHLREEFPSVTIPKIRFLEDKGLINPERTSAGYRKFSHADVERLRYILRMQRDHYLPLKVIGEHLDAIDAGMEPPPLQPVVPTVPEVETSGDGMPSPEAFSRRSTVRLSRNELIKTAEIDEDLCAELEAYGLLPQPKGRSYSADDLVIARTAAELAAFGIEPRHLRAIRGAADREVGLVRQVVEPIRRGRDVGASARAEETASEVAALSVRLHAMLVKVGLHRG